MTLLLVVRLTPLPSVLSLARRNIRLFSTTTFAVRGRMDDSQLLKRRLRDDDNDMMGIGLGLSCRRPPRFHSYNFVAQVKTPRRLAHSERHPSLVPTALPALWDLLDATADLFSDITLAFGGRMDVYFSEDLGTTTGWWVVALGCLGVSRGLEARASRICFMLINLASKPSNKSSRHQTLQLFVTTTTNVGLLRCGLAGKQRTMCHSEGDSLRGLREGIGIIEGKRGSNHIARWDGPNTFAIPIGSPTRFHLEGDGEIRERVGIRKRRRSEPFNLTAGHGASIEGMGQASSGGEADSQGMRDRAGITGGGGGFLKRLQGLSKGRGGFYWDEGGGAPRERLRLYAKALLFFVRGVGWNVPVTLRLDDRASRCIRSIELHWQGERASQRGKTGAKALPFIMGVIRTRDWVLHSVPTSPRGLRMTGAAALAKEEEKRRLRAIDSEQI
ncbi:hypothetical protein B0H34DRAFT_811792 [Crassisporium funariophilum]|nr:hypothetical protein B0H34DRAFT_811789 [Crassisporium funariophilum]KAF8148899.1 hypothetical protein B0H34DRAFT_811792 [Crassisporium funariophilum]